MSRVPTGSWRECSSRATSPQGSRSAAASPAGSLLSTPPPGRPALYRGTKLRGRPTRIRELLACDDDGRNWVGLDPSVDIKRGLQQRKPADEVLKGLLWWWLAATDERALVPADHVTELHDGLAAVVDHLSPNVMEPVARELLAMCEVAMRAGAGVRVKSLSSETIEARERRESIEGDASLVAAG